MLKIYENSPYIGFLYFFVPLGLVRIIFEVTQRNPQVWLASESPLTQLKNSWPPRGTLLLFMGAIILNIAILVRMIWHPGTGLGLLLMNIVAFIFLGVRAKWTTESTNSRLAADLALIACLATFMSFANREATKLATEETALPAPALSTDQLGELLSFVKPKDVELPREGDPRQPSIKCEKVPADFLLVFQPEKILRLSTQCFFVMEKNHPIWRWKISGGVYADCAKINARLTDRLEKLGFQTSQDKSTRPIEFTRPLIVNRKELATEIVVLESAMPWTGGDSEAEDFANGIELTWFIRSRLATMPPKIAAVISAAPHLKPAEIGGELLPKEVLLALSQQETANVHLYRGYHSGYYVTIPRTGAITPAVVSKIESTLKNDGFDLENRKPHRGETPWLYYYRKPQLPAVPSCEVRVCDLGYGISISISSRQE